MRKIILLSLVILISILTTWAGTGERESHETSVLKNELVLIREGREERSRRKKGKKVKRRNKNRMRKRKIRKNKKNPRKSIKRGKKKQRKTKERRKSKESGIPRNKKKVKRRKSRINVGAENPISDPSTSTPMPTSSSCLDCVKNSVSVMDTWRFQVTNFEKQRKRVEKQTSVASSKATKSASFTEMANLLRNISCPNNMMEIDNLTSSLGQCENKVKEACNVTKVNMTFVEECKMMTTSFVVSSKYKHTQITPNSSATIKLSTGGGNKMQGYFKWSDQKGRSKSKRCSSS